MKKLNQEIKFWKKIVIISFGLFICSLIGLIIINYSDISLKENKESQGVVDELTGKKLLCLQPIYSDTLTDRFLFGQSFLVTGFEFLPDGKVDFISDGKYSGTYHKNLKNIFISIPQIHFTTEKEYIFFEKKKYIGLFIKFNRQNLKYKYKKTTSTKFGTDFFYGNITTSCEIFSGDLLLEVMKTSIQVFKERRRKIDQEIQNKKEEKIKIEKELESKQKI